MEDSPALVTLRARESSPSPPSLPTTSTPLPWKLFFLGASCSLSSGLRDTRSPKQRFLAVVVRQRSRDWGKESGLRRRDSLVRGTAARETQEGSCSCWRRACREPSRPESWRAERFGE